MTRGLRLLARSGFVLAVALSGESVALAQSAASSAPAPASSASPAQTPTAAKAPAVARRRAKLLLDDGTTVVGTIVGGHAGVDFFVVTDDGRTRRIARRSIKGGSTLPMVDRVVLDDGTSLEGAVSRVNPGESVTVDKLDGTTQTIEWARVRDVVTRPAQADLPPEATALGAAMAAGGSVKTTTASTPTTTSPQTTTSTQIDTSGGVSLDIDRECAATPDTPRCKEHAHVAVDTHGFAASYDSEDESGRRHADISMTGAHASLERDCAANPDDERCTEKFGVDVGKDGLRAGYNRESVTAVKEPPKTSLGFSIDGGGVFGFGSIDNGTGGKSNLTLYGGGADVAVSLLFGGLLGDGKFPGATGGAWLGFLVQPTGGADLYSMNMSVAGTSASASIFAWRLGGTAALQYLHFGFLDPKTLQQNGFGVAVGGFAGVQGQSGTMQLTIPTPAGNMPVSQDMGSTNASYGPSVILSLPHYNAGTAHYRSESLIFMVLPTGSITFATVQAGVTF